MGTRYRDEGKSEAFIQWQKKFYRSTAWKQARQAVIDRALHRCEYCSHFIHSQATIHHKQPITEDNMYDEDITLGMDNLMLVHHDCHAALHRDTPDFDLTHRKDQLLF